MVITSKLILNIFIFAVISALVVSAAGLKKRYDNDNWIMRIIKHMFIASFGLILFYCIGINAENEMVAQVFISVAIMFYNFVILHFYVFSELYTSHQNYSKVKVRVISTLLELDAISLFVGIFTKHCIYVEQVDFYGSTFYRYVGNWFHPVHYVLSVAVVVYALGMLLYAGIRSPHSYKRRYYNVAISVIMIVGVNMAFHAFGASIDLSSVLLPITVVTIYYYSIVRTPLQFIRESRAAVIDEIPDGIIILNYEGDYVDSNRQATRMLKLSGKKEIDVVAEWIKKNDINIDAHGVKNFVDRDIEGEPIVRVTIDPYYEAKTPAIRAGTVIRIHDNTEDIRQREEEIYDATHDGITGLLNRDAFLDQLKNIMEDQKDVDYYLVCSNIENFKLYNTLFGADEGDVFLENIGKSLSENISGYKLIGRMEADRFALLIPKDRFDEDEFKKAYAIALQTSEKMHYSINVYVGVCEASDADTTATELYNRALIAAQSIKGSSDDFVAFYDETITKQVMDEQKRIDEIREGLANEEFEFYIQPQINNFGEVCGGEALVRWNHPKRGIVSPYFFIDIMERHGMIASLDKVVWKKVCMLLADWKKRGIDKHYISINISPKDFYYMDVRQTILDLVNEYDIDKSKIKLEITETAVMQNEKELISIIDQLRGDGFTVEMDDFGSGYSSLNMLNKMHIDVMKLDMGFLQLNDDPERSRIIISNIESLAKSLGISTVAEGVETVEQADFLREIGCNYMQGYLFSPPIPISEYEEKFITHNIHLA